MQQSAKAKCRWVPGPWVSGPWVLVSRVLVSSGPRVLGSWVPGPRSRVPGPCVLGSWVPDPGSSVYSLLLVTRMWSLDWILLANRVSVHNNISAYVTVIPKSKIIQHVVQSTASLKFHEGRGSYVLCRCIFEAYVKLLFSRSSVVGNQPKYTKKSSLIST